MVTSVKRMLVTLVVLALTLAVSAQVALAAQSGGNNNSGGGGRSAPEAPHAMLLPLFGVLAVAAIWIMLARMRRRVRVTADEAI